MLLNQVIKVVDGKRVCFQPFGEKKVLTKDGEYLTEKEKTRFDELQDKENNHTITPDEEKEYEVLQKKAITASDSKDSKTKDEGEGSVVVVPTTAEEKKSENKGKNKLPVFGKAKDKDSKTKDRIDEKQYKKRKEELEGQIKMAGKDDPHYNDLVDQLHKLQEEYGELPYHDCKPSYKDKALKALDSLKKRGK